MDEPDPEADEATPSEPRTLHEGAVIDVSAALHMAGHESELLGLDGLADTGPLVHAGTPDEDGESAAELAHRIGSPFTAPEPKKHE